MWKDKLAHLDNGNDPRKKLVFGLVALLCVISLSLICDVVQTQVFAPDKEHSAQPITPDQGSEKSDTSADKKSDKSDSGSESAEDKEDKQLMFGGMPVKNAEDLKALDQIDTSLLSSLADYVSSYLKSKDFDTSKTILSVSQPPIITQQSYVIYLDVDSPLKKTSLVCSKTNLGWTVSEPGSEDAQANLESPSPEPKQ